MSTSSGKNIQITEQMVERACVALDKHGSWRVNIAHLNGDDPNEGMRLALEAALNGASTPEQKRFCVMCNALILESQVACKDCIVYAFEAVGYPKTTEPRNSEESK